MMMRSLLAFLIFSFGFMFFAYAQEISPCDTATFYYVAEIMPQFPGGDEALMEYMKTTIFYPSTEMNCGMENTIILSFVIDTTGKATCIEITRPESGSCILQNGFGDRMIAMIHNMPLWSPAMQQGKKIGVKMNLPIRITFDE